MTTDRETRRLSRVGLIGLLAAVLIGVMAPVIGGLNSSPHSYQGVRLEPGASAPLFAGRQVVLDSGDGSVHMGNCLITGPGKWFRQIVGAGATSSFQTGPAGDYKIICQGGAVEVENEVGGHLAADLNQRPGHRVTIGMFLVAGVVGVAGLAALIRAARAGGQQRKNEGGLSRTEAESATDAGEPKTH